MRLDEIIGRLRDKPNTLTFVDDKGDQTVKTFHELFIDVLATIERGKGLGLIPGCRVGIAAPSAYLWMVWDLACIGLECVSVALPNDRLHKPCAASIDQYQLTVMVVEPGWPAPDAPPHERVVGINVAPDTQAGYSQQVLPVVVQHAPDTHSMVFSSGTTGKNKGLIVSRAGTENLLNLYFDAFGFEPGDRFLTFLPFANYQQRMIYYYCLYHGVDFVAVPFQLLFASLKLQRPTFVIAPPVLYETLQNLARASVGTHKGDDAAGHRGALSQRLKELTGGNMRYMITGMAPIKRAALDFFWECGIPLFEAFGITEAGMVAWNKPGCVRVGTVGKPAEAGSVSLSGEGEVIVTRKALLSLGYFESSEEDARSTFIGPNAVATGDIGEFDDDGFLRVIGRKKDAIVTSNGEKFHPEPIETMLHQDPRVEVAVVMAGRRAGLCVVISTRRHDDPEVTQALRVHVATVNKKLAAQRQLTHIVFTGSEFSVENGLRTSNLKLNRRAIAKAFLPPG
ncbi:long-chain fatty acid--CoA ligase [Paraburkholderia panacisoli]|uniref:Long-chain fatty acid--CoA ligase n=1 Tax=Paraburkholderia panacisoli TaxID=2603818 RepID=A0A5B0GKH4_9BURK|nr:AMP-binding protein [Paraburkholderia panacisoli]KAA1003856.1 long-chain fatty acid--CoA ligase [Paraburkholderia panacisoli]